MTRRRLFSWLLLLGTLILFGCAESKNNENVKVIPSSTGRIPPPGK
jgi:hypothetical protein